MKKLLTYFLSSLLGMGLVFAAEMPDSFQIEVNPSSFAINQPVDITVKAIKNNKIMRNYVGEFFMAVLGKVNGKEISTVDYTLPAFWFWGFELTDQGVKTYSKGLKIAKPGSFTIIIQDASEKQLGSATVIVKNEQDSTVRNISILSPSAGIEENKDVINVIAKSAELTNARMQILLNDLPVAEGTSDASGLLSETIEGLKNGTNYVQIKAVSLAGEVVGMSDKVIFTYTPQSDALFKDITANPNTDLKLGDKVHFEVFTDDAVSSAKLLFTGGKEYPLDKEKDWLFSKDIQMIWTGEVELGVFLSAGAERRKTYDKVYSFSVKDNTQIWEIQFLLSKQLAGNLELSWVVEGAKSEHYAIKYGLSKDEMPGLVMTTGEVAQLSGLIYGKEYFFQVFATTADQIPQGLPSEIVSFKMPIAEGNAPNIEALTGGELEPEHPAAPKIPACILKNIKLTTEKIGNKYYLVWKPGKNVSKYLVYKSDFADGTNKTFLGETTTPRFEYPFDKTAEEDVYAYYSVEALCDDGTTLSIADAKKVQVGPLEDMMLVFASTALLYLLYRLYYYSV